MDRQIRYLMNGNAGTFDGGIYAGLLNEKIDGKAIRFISKIRHLIIALGKHADWLEHYKKNGCNQYH